MPEVEGERQVTVRRIADALGIAVDDLIAPSQLVVRSKEMNELLTAFALLESPAARQRVIAAVNSELSAAMAKGAAESKPA